MIFTKIKTIMWLYKVIYEGKLINSLPNRTDYDIPAKGSMSFNVKLTAVLKLSFLFIPKAPFDYNIADFDVRYHT